MGVPELIEEIACQENPRMSRCQKEGPRLTIRSPRGPGRKEVAAREGIVAGNRAVKAPALLQLLVPPAGSPWEVSCPKMEEAFLKLIPRI